MDTIINKYEYFHQTFDIGEIDFSTLEGNTKFALILGKQSDSLSQALMDNLAGYDVVSHDIFFVSRTAVITYVLRKIIGQQNLPQ